MLRACALILRIGDLRKVIHVTIPGGVNKGLRMGRTPITSAMMTHAPGGPAFAGERDAGVRAEVAREIAKDLDAQQVQAGFATRAKE